MVPSLSPCCTSNTVFGPGISNDGTINTSSGNDIIAGDGQGAIAIYNTNTINTGTGNDTITILSFDSEEGYGDGLVNENGATIDTGSGNDTITASVGGSGISNSGSIWLGDGNDSLYSEASLIFGDYDGLINSGSIWGVMAMTLLQSTPRAPRVMAFPTVASSIPALVTTSSLALALKLAFPTPAPSIPVLVTTKSLALAAANTASTISDLASLIPALVTTQLLAVSILIATKNSASAMMAPSIPVPG